MNFTEAVILSAALSIDALIIGAACSASGIRLTLLSRAVMGAVSFTVTGTAVWAGGLLSQLTTPGIGSALGSLMLLAVGVYSLVRCLRSVPDNNEKSLRVSSAAISDPEKCDVDNSKTIEPAEALFTGLTLSLDSFGAGIGAGASGGEALVPFLCAAFQIVFLYAGNAAGQRLLRRAGKQGGRIGGIISSSVIIVLSVVRILF